MAEMGEYELGNYIFSSDFGHFVPEVSVINSKKLFMRLFPN
jgi:hypothetical protein